MGRDPVTQEILGRKVTTRPLPFPLAQELLPEVGELLSLMVNQLGKAIMDGNINIAKDDILKLAPVLGEISKFFGSGRLARLAPKVLSTTVVVMPDAKGELENQFLEKEKDRNYTFDEQPELFFPVLFFAGRTTFQRFFPANALSAAAIQKPSS